MAPPSHPLASIQMLEWDRRRNACQAVVGFHWWRRRSLTAQIDVETRQAGLGGTSAVARRWFPIAPWRLSLQNTVVLPVKSLHGNDCRGAGISWTGISWREWGGLRTREYRTPAARRPTNYRTSPSVVVARSTALMASHKLADVTHQSCSI